jgi:hypothetical protein
MKETAAATSPATIAMVLMSQFRSIATTLLCTRSLNVAVPGKAPRIGGIAQKRGYGLEKPAICGLIRKDKVIARFQRHELRTANASGKQLTFAERYAQITTRVHDQGWRPDLGQEIDDIRVGGEAENALRHFRRGSNPL